MVKTAFFQPAEQQPGPATAPTADLEPAFEDATVNLRRLAQLRDAGVITDPMAGRIRPSREQLGGRGLWFVNQLCDLVQIRSFAGQGTCVRLWIDLPA